MHLWNLAAILDVLVVDIVQIDGLLFINDAKLPLVEMRVKVATYSSQKEAQAWLNILLLDGLISEIFGDEWDDDEPASAQVISAISRAWSYQIDLKFPGASYSIETVSDTEYGDFGIRLLGSIAW